MNRLFGTALAVTAVVFAGAAFAGDIKGTVKAVDAGARTVTLQDNSIYRFGTDLPMPNVGQDVAITFTTVPINDATKVAITPKAAAK